ncbi:MAG: hypothetical protein JHC95_04130 [Solirubrobacteraceae bacterium]|nr:hypothetical protein [Solirubrobacteraceae bacterium]
MSVAVGAPAQLEDLREMARELGVLLEPAAVPAGGAARDAWLSELEDRVFALSSGLPEGTEDYDARRLWELLHALRRTAHADTDRVELAAMMLGDVTRRLGRRLLHDELDDPRAAADDVLRTLAATPATDVARLLGVSTKTIGAWRAGKPVTRNAERIVLVAHVITYLRASLTPSGLIQWFAAPREQLAGRTPLELLDGPLAPAREALISLARGARGQLAD